MNNVKNETAIQSAFEMCQEYENNMRNAHV